MYELNLPKYKFRIRKGADQKNYIFDAYRKKELLLTPEEWVRQHIIRFLIEEKGYPQSLIAVEAGVKVNKLSRRYDALIYARSGQPAMLVECKAPEVSVTQQTFDQALAYNQTLKAPYILITNGLKHFCCKQNTSTNNYEFLRDIPAFDAL